MAKSPNMRPTVEELRRLGLNEEQIKRHLEGWVIAHRVRAMGRMGRDGDAVGIDVREMMARENVKKATKPRIPRVRIGAENSTHISEPDHRREYPR